MKKLNISYARQSFKRAEADSSVIWQKQLIFEYAAKQGYSIDIHFDDIKSGNRTDRIGLQDLRRLINDDKVASLTVYRIDRIYRNYRQALEFFQLCAEKEIILYSIEDGTFNFNKPEERLAIQVLSATAENQREQAVQNRLLSNKRKFEHRQPVNYEAPFGYRYEDHNFISVPAEAKTVEFIFRSYITGQGYKKISMLTKQDSWIYRSPGQVKNVITNPKYYGDFVGIHGTLSDFLPAIISRETFDQAQRIRQQRAEHRKQTGTVNARLRSKIICPYCASKLTPFHNRGQKNSTPVYMCQKRISGHYNDCSLKAVNLKTIEYEVQNYITQFLTSPSELHKLRDTVRHQLDHRQSEQVRKGKNIYKLKQQKIDQLATGKISVTEFKDWISTSTKQTKAAIPEVEVNTDDVMQLLQTDVRIKQELFDNVDLVYIDTTGSPIDIRMKGLNKNIIKFKQEENGL